MALQRAEAVQRLEKLNLADVQVADLVSLPRKERIAAIRAAAVVTAGRTGRKMSDESVDVFLEALSTGLCVDDAAAIAGVSPYAVYRRRKRDPEFAAVWEAMYALGSAPLERRVQQIGLTGDAGSMATVRALEIGLRARHGSLAHPRQAAPAATAEMRKHADGSQSFTVSIGSPGAH